MKVLMVSDCGSIHTERWALSLADAGIDVVLFSITPGNPGIYAEKGIKLQVFDLFRYKKKKNGSLKGAIFSFFEALSAHCRAVRSLKRLIAAEKPDLLHAHYATSYGLVAALSGFHPLMVSVWGSDVYEFPRLSALNRMAVRFILGKADRVLSTSHAMAEETSRYCRKDIGITPFGVDTDLFRPAADSAGKDATVVFATVKTMSSRYGIDLLIKAYAQMRRKLHFGNPLQAVPDTLLRIAGDGPDLAMLRRLAEDEGVAPFVEFAGRIDHGSVPGFYGSADVAVFLSRAESFGVSAVEAMACGLPVVASSADGFREVLQGGAGILVPIEDVSAAADAMLLLATEPDLRHSIGQAGRERAVKCYDWRDNVALMTEEYSRLCRKI